MVTGAIPVLKVCTWHSGVSKGETGVLCERVGTGEAKSNMGGYKKRKSWEDYRLCLFPSLAHCPKGVASISALCCSLDLSIMPAGQALERECTCRHLCGGGKTVSDWTWYYH